ncbi:succinate dehydrogenase subunit D [Jezberella montanilacus]|uniref:Succinate dehydrogenase hydrophobic membrane anchor subunit n=1 Tax=Jezberella montanilacus TaxID=323426 RepID=A0A2T0XKD5_9BURK|nr:succinate dehydrogenase, hydrophobic membrane anchor protein [Jezberella montanilacus]PRY99396.1 succinate dehydrogenase subunit D [Jezberella montanilacus]
MALNEKIGTKRLVVGAHYGTFEYLAQRVTAIIMAVYTLVLLVGILTMSGFTYQGWHNLFTFTVVMMPIGQILGSLTMISLAWHAWIGVRDIWMDYVGHVGVRLFLMVMTLLWLVGSVVYFINILWRN